MTCEAGFVSAYTVRLGLEPELDTMMEKETMATEKMVPFTMGTLDTKSIGLTSATIRARVYLLHVATIKPSGQTSKPEHRRWRRKR